MEEGAGELQSCQTGCIGCFIRSDAERSQKSGACLSMFTLDYVLQYHNWRIHIP